MSLQVLQLTTPGVVSSLVAELATGRRVESLFSFIFLWRRIRLERDWCDSGTFLPRGFGRSLRHRRSCERQCHCGFIAGRIVEQIFDENVNVVRRLQSDRTNPVLRKEG